MKVLTCTAWDNQTDTCAVQVWADPPGVLPPLPAEQGIHLSGLVISLCAMAWGVKFLRRFMAPRFG